MDDESEDDIFYTVSFKDEKEKKSSPFWSAREIEADHFYKQNILPIFEQESKKALLDIFLSSPSFQCKKNTCQKSKPCCLNQITKYVLIIWSKHIPTLNPQFSENFHILTFYEILRRIYHQKEASYSIEELRLFIEYGLRTFYIYKNSSNDLKFNQQRLLGLTLIFKEKAESTQKLYCAICLCVMASIAALSLIAFTVILFVLIDLAIKYALYVKMISLIPVLIAGGGMYKTFKNLSTEKAKVNFYKSVHSEGLKEDLTTPFLI